MYHRQNINNQKPYQHVDFFSFKKKTSQTNVSFSNNKLTLSGEHESTIVTILGFFQLSSNMLINQDIFQKANFDFCPKVFQSYTHEKTMKAILKVVINKIQSPSSLAQLINQFPIVIFIIQAFCRVSCLNYIKNNKQLQFFGNQQSSLEDYSLQIRGNLLYTMAETFGTQIHLNFGQVQEVYGQQKNPRKISIKYNQNLIQAELISKRPNYINRTNPNSAAKTLKQIGSKETQTSQSAQTSIGQNSSLLRQSIVTDGGKCQKCKQTKVRCLCIKKAFNSPYNTPKSGTKYQKTPVQSTLNVNMNITSISKCTCNKIICVCKK